MGAFRWIKEHMVLMLIVVVALLTGYASHKYYGGKIAKLASENQRLEQNQQSLLLQCDTLTMEGGRHLIRVKQLELVNEELVALCNEQYKQIDALGIKAKHLEHVIATGSHTKVVVDTIARDSIVYVQVPAGVEQDTLKAWSWADNWVTAHGTISKAGRVRAEFESTDSLLIVANRVPKRFLFFRYGTKYVELNVVSSNPHTRLFYAKSIKLRKK